MQTAKRAILAISASSMLLAAASVTAQSAAAIRASVTVHADQPGATIHRNVYGQFAEHLGSGIYDGVWVGEDSEIPNTRGYRNDVLAALKALEIPVVRWPGGCFADEYHWRDGIGPRDERPVRINTTWGWCEESNAFGTHEFLDFAELIGADAYVAANVGTGSPTEMVAVGRVHHVRLEIHAGGTAPRQRARPSPGNCRISESATRPGAAAATCGRSTLPTSIADSLHSSIRRATTARKRSRAARMSDDYHWTETMLSRAARYMDAYSLHYYTIPSGNWEKKGASTGFAEDEWAATIANAMRMDELVSKHSAIMDEHDPDKRIGLYVDEWGNWYDPEPGRNAAFLYQQNTIRDAVTAASTLHIFHRHSDRVRMSMIAQMVNVLQAMILTDGPRMVLTPTYHVFKMHIPFQDSTFLPAEVDSPEYRRGEFVFPAVDVSVARGKDGRIHLSLVNRDPDSRAEIEIEIEGAETASATGQLLTGPALDSRNTFDEPGDVEPAALTAQAARGRLMIELPPKSVAVLALD